MLLLINWRDRDIIIIFRHSDRALTGPDLPSAFSPYKRAEIKVKHSHKGPTVLILAMAAPFITPTLGSYWRYLSGKFVRIL
jgi:hypothetical protein